MNIIEQIKVNDVSIDGYQGTYYFESPEWVRVITDSEDKVLAGIKADGTVEWSDGVPTPVREYIEQQFEEQLDLKVDKEENKSLIDSSVAESMYFIDSPEYIQVTTDREDKIVMGIKENGAIYIPILLNDSIDLKLDNAIERIDASLNEVLTKVGPSAEYFSEIDDPEGRSEITTDSDGKIISYRKANGTKVENVGVESESITTNYLNLSDGGMTEFQQALKDSGFSSGQGDWSDYISNDGENPLNLAIPRCAIVNIITSKPFHLLTKEGQPNAEQGVNYDVPSVIEFWDMQGNYFKKPILISAQGQGSLSAAKRNLSIDLFDTSVYNSKGKIGKGDALKIKFGSWVSQDSFHLKGYLSDALRCRGAVGYRIYNDMLLTRGIFEDYTWKRGTINKSSITHDNTGVSDMNGVIKQFETGARCFPDGFPFVLYENGSFYGLFSWQLKKHRDNYKLGKSKATNVWIDSTATDIWDMNGNLDWDVLTHGSGSRPLPLEIRNPKDLYVLNDNGEIVKHNTDYADGVGELMSPGMPGYDSNNPDHVRSAEVKEVLVEMSKIMPSLEALDEAYEADKTSENLLAFKNKFETHFDVNNLIDYQIISQFLCHEDNWVNNWQWFTYNGVKWFCELYDLDQIWAIWSPIHGAFDGVRMFLLLVKYYKHELVGRYNELRQKEILSTENAMKYFREYLNAWGYELYNKEMEKWGDNTRVDSLLRIAAFIDDNISSMDNLYVE